jgi:hypothetical protein
VSNANNPCTGPRPDRVIRCFTVPGTALAADEMARHLRHLHALGQPQDFWIEIQVPLWPALQWTSSSFPSRIISPMVTGLNRSGWCLRRLGLINRSVSSSTSSGSLAMSFEIRRGLVHSEPALKDSNCARHHRHAPDEMVWPPGLIQIGPNLCYRCLLKF